MNRTACPDEILLVRYANKQLSSLEEEAIIKHLVTCDPCREFLTLQIRINRETASEPASEEEIDRVTGGVLTLIDEDDAPTGKK